MQWQQVRWAPAPGDGRLWAAPPTAVANVAGLYTSARFTPLMPKFHWPCSPEALRRGNPGHAGEKSVWALDFDGVVCDSCGESSLSAWKVGRAGAQPAPTAARPLVSMENVLGATGSPPSVLLSNAATAAFSPQAASKMWPEVFASPEAQARKGELVERMRDVRPVVETG